MPAFTAVDAESASQSAEASLHGHRALTPILSGAISGGIVGVAWIIGLIAYIFRRVRTSKRAHAAGFRSHRQLLDSPKEVEAFIIPPDPAIIKGQLSPGENVFVDEPRLSHGDERRHAKTVPIAHIDEEREVSPSGPSAQPLTHSNSAPPRLSRVAGPSLSTLTDPPHI